jgi:hypothetical protein
MSTAALVLGVYGIGIVAALLLCRGSTQREVSEFGERLEDLDRKE